MCVKVREAYIQVTLYTEPTVPMKIIDFKYSNVMVNNVTFVHGDGGG